MVLLFTLVLVLLHSLNKTKKIYDEYQKARGIDLWKTHYERMQEHLRKLKDTNNKLRREIRQRMGEDLHSLSIYQLRSLEAKMDESLTNIRDRKYHVIKTSTDTYRKKVKSLEQRHGSLLMGFDAKCEDPQYGLMDNDDGDYDYDYPVALGNGVSNIYTYRNSQHNHHPHHFHHGGEFGSHDLRLA